MDVRCNQCHWQGSEEQLVPIYKPNSKEPGDVIPVPGCPGCLSDQFLEYGNMTMTTQEKIREGTAKWLFDTDYQFTAQWKDAQPFLKAEYYKKADDLLSYLHSQGVVIKVERKLPIPHTPVDGLGVMNESYAQGAKNQREICSKAGYVAVEPLIKEG